MCQVIRVAQQNREILAGTFKLSTVDMKNKSHLVVRLLPDNLPSGVSSQMSVIDFVELCGSDLSATPSFATNNRAEENDRKFATTSFNSLSQGLLATAFKQPFKK